MCSKPKAAPFVPGIEPMTSKYDLFETYLCGHKRSHCCQEQLVLAAVLVHRHCPEKPFPEGGVAVVDLDRFCKGASQGKFIGKVKDKEIGFKPCPRPVVNLIKHITFVNYYSRLALTRKLPILRL